MPSYTVELSHLVFISSFNPVLLFHLSSFFFILFTVISGVHQYQTAIRLPRGWHEAQTSTVQIEPFQWALWTLNAKRFVVCSHQCHKIVPKTKATRFSQPDTLIIETTYIWKHVKENSEHNKIHIEYSVCIHICTSDQHTKENKIRSSNSHSLLVQKDVL